MKADGLLGVTGLAACFDSACAGAGVIGRSGDGALRFFAGCDDEDFFFCDFVLLLAGAFAAEIGSDSVFFWVVRRESEAEESSSSLSGEESISEVREDATMGLDGDSPETGAEGAEGGGEVFR